MLVFFFPFFKVTLIHVFVVAGLLQQPPYVTKGSLHTGMKGQDKIKMFNLNLIGKLSSFEFVSICHNYM